MTTRQAPATHEFEVSVFGRGYGESILLHLGDGRWVLIDSLRDKDDQVSALRYLDEIGADSSTAIQLIVVTHWHDDHIKGIGDAYARAKDADLALPVVMTTPEVAAFQRRVRQGGTILNSSGTAEIDRTRQIQYDERRRAVVPAVANKALLRIADSEISHRHPITIEALSPSNKDVQTFLETINKVPNIRLGRVQPFNRNDISIALWIAIGDHRVLLGADLETTEDAERGWKAILNSRARVSGTAAVIKIPHHGSENGHHQPVWDEMLLPNPIAALTTWNKNTKLPTSDDVRRISELTPNAYVTSRLFKSNLNRPNAVERKIRESNIKLRALPERAGHVRLRLNLLEASPSWQVALYNGALPLSEFAA